jgi:hypothetical protein
MIIDWLWLILFIVKQVKGLNWLLCMCFRRFWLCALGVTTDVVANVEFSVGDRGVQF